jgi:hypothetical protein
MVTFLAWWTGVAIVACSGIIAWVLRHNARLH